MEIFILTVCLVSNQEKNGNSSKIDKNRTLCIGIWLLAARAKSLLLVWAVKRDDRHKLGIFMSLKKVCQSDWIRYKIVLLLSIVCGIRYGYLYRIVRGFIVGTTTQTFNFFSAFTRRPLQPTNSDAISIFKGGGGSTRTGLDKPSISPLLVYWPHILPPALYVCSELGFIAQYLV